MSKVMKCREVGMDCDFVARGENENEELTKAAAHAKATHGMDTIPDDVLRYSSASLTSSGIVFT